MVKEHKHQWRSVDAYDTKMTAKGQTYKVLSHYQACKVVGCNVARKPGKVYLANEVTLSELQVTVNQFDEVTSIEAHGETTGYDDVSTRLVVNGINYMTPEEVAEAKQSLKDYKAELRAKELERLNEHKELREQALEHARQLLREAGEL